MKIVQINSHYNQGGAARIVACIHKQLLVEGIDSYVFYGRGEETNVKNIFRFNNPYEVYFSAFISRFLGINGWCNKRATKRLIKQLKEIGPDVVHIHTLHGYYIHMPLIMKYIAEEKIPCIWTFHDCHAFVGNCGYFFDCRKWEVGCENCPRIEIYPRSQWFDFTRWMWKQKKKYTTAIENLTVVSPSKWLTEEAKKSFLGNRECITIPNGIDTKDLFYPRDKRALREKYQFRKEEKIVLGIAVGFSDPRKGGKYIIQLAKDLGNEVTVVLIGWDSKENHLLHGVENVKTLSNTQNAYMLAEYYCLADVFVIPSLAENYATTTLEAMACGTPVVGFAVGGIPEQLEDGKGIAVEAKNQEAFHKAVRKVLFMEIENEELLSRDERAKRIQKENNLEVMSRAYRKIYEEWR